MLHEENEKEREKFDVNLKEMYIQVIFLRFANWINK